MKRGFQKQLIQAEKEYMKQEMCLREAIRKKDHCIDRLSLVIEQMRKARYESVDRITREAIKKNWYSWAIYALKGLHVLRFALL